jgi:hypothetical protein
MIRRSNKYRRKFIHRENSSRGKLSVCDQRKLWLVHWQFAEEAKKLRFLPLMGRKRETFLKWKVKAFDDEEVLKGESFEKSTSTGIETEIRQRKGKGTN